MDTDKIVFCFSTKLTCHVFFKIGVHHVSMSTLQSFGILLASHFPSLVHAHIWSFIHDIIPDSPGRYHPEKLEATGCISSGNFLAMKYACTQKLVLIFDIPIFGKDSKLHKYLWGTVKSSGYLFVLNMKLVCDILDYKVFPLFWHFGCYCFFLTSGRKNKKTKKYGVLATSGTDVELRPLDDDDEEDEDVTVFDTNRWGVGKQQQMIL